MHSRDFNVKNGDRFFANFPFLWRIDYSYQKVGSLDPLQKTEFLLKILFILLHKVKTLDYLPEVNIVIETFIATVRSNCDKYAYHSNKYYNKARKRMDYKQLKLPIRKRNEFLPKSLHPFCADNYKLYAKNKMNLARKTKTKRNLL